MRGRQKNNMRLRLIILTWLTLSTLTNYGQEIKKCDLASLAGKEIGQLTQSDILDFLLTFDKECRNNVEYSEVSNELLFTILDKQTELILLTLKKYEKSISSDLIIEELTTPINDSFDLKQLIKKVAKTSADNDLKRKVIDNLKIADSKLN
jgi:hypothetical protein